MEQLASHPPKPKRGRPRKYTSTKEKKLSKIAQQRNQRQSTRAAKRAQQFDQHYTTARSLSTDNNGLQPTYFPPEELCLATEVEQLLPPLSPELRPCDPSIPEVSPMTNLPLESMPDLDNVPAPDTPPENERNDSNQETSESSILAADTLMDIARNRPQSSGTNAADSLSDLARLLTDQLQQHHGCCPQCHEQQKREHHIKHTKHVGLGEYMDQIQAEGGILGRS
ncbi:hypothetical protein N7524_011672 [Penicillium chrysogenum]|nr:hypothetical protein N7524_011672 [Penicillium chrysogenum]